MNVIQNIIIASDDCSLPIMKDRRGYSWRSHGRHEGVGDTISVAISISPGCLAIGRACREIPAAHGCKRVVQIAILLCASPMPRRLLGGTVYRLLLFLYAQGLLLLPQCLQKAGAFVDECNWQDRILLQKELDGDAQPFDQSGILFALQVKLLFLIY